MERIGTLLDPLKDLKLTIRSQKLKAMEKGSTEDYEALIVASPLVIAIMERFAHIDLFMVDDNSNEEFTYYGMTHGCNVYKDNNTEREYLTIYPGGDEEAQVIYVNGLMSRDEHKSGVRTLLC
jgi:hypothetical protein